MLQSPFETLYMSLLHGRDGGGRGGAEDAEVPPVRSAAGRSRPLGAKLRPGRGEVGSDRSCLPRHYSHCRPSFLEIIDIEATLYSTRNPTLAAVCQVKSEHEKVRQSVASKSKSKKRGSITGLDLGRKGLIWACDWSMLSAFAFAL